MRIFIAQHGLGLHTLMISSKPIRYQKRRGRKRSFYGTGVKYSSSIDREISLGIKAHTDMHLPDTKACTNFKIGHTKLNSFANEDR